MPEGGPIVCNTGPLIALTLSGHLDLLETLFSRVLVPNAVFQEIGEATSGRSGAVALHGASWLERIPDEPIFEPLLLHELGSGEAAVISLARRHNARLVLIDERRARRIAEQVYGLRVKGSAGILVAAKRAGLLPAVKPILALMARHGYHLSHRLIERAAAEAGE
jgi:uncharacterized protein